MALAIGTAAPYSGAMRSLGLVLSLACVTCAASARAQKQPVSLEQALGQGSRVRWFSAPAPVAWAPDGKHYIQRRDGKAVWINPDTGEESAPPKGSEGRGSNAGSRPRRRRSAGGGRDSRLAVRDGDLVFGRGDEAVRLTRDGEKKDVVSTSPDGKFASFVRANNLAVVATAGGGEEWRVTTDGSPAMFCGILDWVYQEELYGRGNFRGHWWSPDSQAIAYLRLDEKDVKTFTIVDFVPQRKLSDERSVEPELQKYPKAGDPNPTARLLVALPAERKSVEVDLSGYDQDVLVVRVGWTPDNRVLFAVQDRIQTWMDLNVADPKTGKRTLMLRETSDTWVNRPEFPRWLKDGSFLWFSERSGYQHIYHYQADGQLIRAVTAGDWQVRGITRFDEATGSLWFTGTKDGAINDNLYRVQLDGSGLTRLTTGPGRHRAQLNADASWLLDTVSSVDEPTKVMLCKGDGSSARILDRARAADVEKFVYSPKQQLTITARDGYPLDATLIKPPDFDPTQNKYPIYLPTYSGPDAPSVRNSFSVSTMQQYLAQRGCLILQVNVRSASGRGQAHTGLAYKRLGVFELRDLEDAVDHVVADFGGDPERVAIDGWSYGGFMAAYALTHSTKFSLGIAGAGVHDWQLYDTIYTERYMSTPQKNPDGYRETSVLEAAKNLSGHLVLMHGARDDNVHLQNTVRLIYELQAAGKDDFELMLYPRDRHGVRSSHRTRYVWRTLRDHLLRASASGE